MQQLLYILPVLACPIGMGAMMWLMMRTGNKHQHTGGPATPAQEQELTRLRTEIADLRSGLQARTTEAADKTVATSKPAGATQ